MFLILYLVALTYVALLYNRCSSPPGRPVVAAVRPGRQWRARASARRRSASSRQSGIGLEQHKATRIVDEVAAHDTIVIATHVAMVETITDRAKGGKETCVFPHLFIYSGKGPKWGVQLALTHCAQTFIHSSKTWWSLVVLTVRVVGGSGAQRCLSFL